MAFGLRSDFNQNPWMSHYEWELVFNQIYSNDIAEQKKSYETMLVWKARSAVIPAGIECTLELLEVCLRDVDWSTKIDNAEMPIHYENDLRRMYSTAIMRFLNHICNLRKTKNESLYDLCKKMNIPSWVVNLRHDAAHSNELPPISSMRNATQLLFEWLHNEYWFVELKRMQKCIEENMEIKYDGSYNTLVDLFMLWVSSGLYIKAGYKLVDEIPIDDLKKSLIKLTSQEQIINTNNNVKKNSKLSKNEPWKSIELETAKNIVLSEITKLFHKNAYFSNSRIINEALTENEIFLPSAEFLKLFTDELHLKKLPPSFLEFWKDFIIFLQRKKLLESLFLHLLEIIQNDNVDGNKKLLASLWISALIDAVDKKNLSENIALNLEQVLDFKNRTIDSKLYCSKIENQLLKINPEYKDVLTLDYDGPTLNCLCNSKFLEELITNANEYGIKYIPNVLKLMYDLEEEKKKEIINIVNIFEHDLNEENDAFEGKIYTVQDFDQSDDEELEVEVNLELADITCRNSDWSLAQDQSWADYGIGFAPWKCEMNDTSVSSVTIVPHDSNTFTPGFLEVSQKSPTSKINWKDIIKSSKYKKRQNSDKIRNLLVKKSSRKSLK